jgi:hypothetical protein
MVIEDKESINAWADQTFGPASSNARVAAKGNEEMARKMAINRTRQWNLTADGHGYHVRDKTNAPR